MVATRTRTRTLVIATRTRTRILVIVTMIVPRTRTTMVFYMMMTCSWYGEGSGDERGPRSLCSTTKTMDHSDDRA